jgi:DNA-directed RNA polymerase III subunit RPC4
MLELVVAREESMTVDQTEQAAGINLANAVDLSESEEEEDLEDIIDDFAVSMDMESVQSYALCLHCMHR